MGSMSSKEARRRGMMPSSPSRYGTGKNEFETDVRLPEGYAAGVIREPIMFGGLGNINWFGNEPEAKLSGGHNLSTRGLYGAPAPDEEDAIQYLGQVSTLGNPVTDLLNKNVIMGLDVGHLALLGAVGYWVIKNRM